MPSWSIDERIAYASDQARRLTEAESAVKRYQRDANMARSRLARAIFHDGVAEVSNLRATELDVLRAICSAATPSDLASFVDADHPLDYVRSVVEQLAATGMVAVERRKEPTGQTRGARKRKVFATYTTVVPTALGIQSQRGEDFWVDEVTPELLVSREALVAKFRPVWTGHS